MIPPWRMGSSPDQNTVSSYLFTTAGPGLQNWWSEFPSRFRRWPSRSRCAVDAQTNERHRSSSAPRSWPQRLRLGAADRMHTRCRYIQVHGTAAFFTLVGFCAATLAFLIGVISVFVKWLSGDIGVPDYTSLILTIAFFSSIILVGIRVVGEYIGRIISEVSGSPAYQLRRATGPQHLSDLLSERGESQRGSC